MLAALLALTTVPNSNARVLCFVDNLDAKAALVTGRATRDVASHVVRAFWYVAMMRALTVWIDYVHTGSNLAGRPSRQCALANPSQSTATRCPPARPATIASIFQTSWEPVKLCPFPDCVPGNPYRQWPFSNARNFLRRELSHSPYRDGRRRRLTARRADEPEGQ